MFGLARTRRWPSLALGLIVGCGGPAEPLARPAQIPVATVAELASPSMDRRAAALERLATQQTAAWDDETIGAVVAVAMHDGEGEHRRIAVELLAKLPGDHPAVATAMAAAVDDPLPSVAAASVRGLAAGRVVSAEILRSLGQSLARDGVRTPAVLALAGADAAVAGPVVADRLRHGSPAARWAAARVAWRWGPAAVALTPTLAEALADGDAAVRAAAADALSAIGPAAAAAAKPLAAALNDPDSAVRCNAAYALGRLGDAARGTEPIVAAAARGGDEDLRTMAAWAVGRLRGGDGK